MFGFPGDFFVKKCFCGLVFLDPIPGEDTLKKYYPSTKYYAYTTNKGEGFFTKLREYLIKNYYSKNLVSKIISTLINNVPAIPSWRSDGKILDVGCGSGETLVLLKKIGWDVYGLDIDKSALRMAKERGISNTTYGTFKNISDFPDNYFDAVRMYHVIEHLDNPVEALKIIHKKLKKNGEIIIGTPNTKSVISRLFGKYWLNLDTPRHVILFNPDILKKILIQEKYIVNEVHFCSAGGILGSVGYFLADLRKTKINLLNKTWLVLLFYPIEWFFDKLKVGDVFVIKATK